VNVTPEVARRRHAQNATRKIALPDTFVRSAYQEQYLGLFWSSYLPNGRAFAPESSRFTNGVWTNELHRLFRVETESGLRKILLALCLTSVGRRDDKPWMVENGIKFYGSALGAMASQLEDGAGTVTDRVLATSRLLSLYEVSAAGFKFALCVPVRIGTGKPD
jgi:hypothetical protein